MEKEKAIEILSVLADGVDPFTGEIFSQDSPYQNVEVVRALHQSIENMRGRLAKPKREKLAAAELIELSPEEEVLYDEMRTWRNQLAEKMEIKPFMIVNNATLREIVKSRVDCKGGFLEIRGMGERKTEQYGDAIIEALNKIIKDEKSNKKREVKQAI